MTDEELAAIETRAQIRNWSTEEDRDILALVAEVRRLREERRQHWNRWDPTNASDAT